MTHEVPQVSPQEQMRFVFGVTEQDSTHFRRVSGFWTLAATGALVGSGVLASGAHPETSSFFLPVAGAAIMLASYQRHQSDRLKELQQQYPFVLAIYDYQKRIQSYENICYPEWNALNVRIRVMRNAQQNLFAGAWEISQLPPKARYRNWGRLWPRLPEVTREIHALPQDVRLMERVFARATSPSERLTILSKEASRVMKIVHVGGDRDRLFLQRVAKGNVTNPNRPILFEIRDAAERLGVSGI